MLDGGRSGKSTGLRTAPTKLFASNHRAKLETLVAELLDHLDGASDGVDHARELR